MPPLEGNNMEFNEYQKIAATTKIFPSKWALEYLTLGLSGESGEIANKVKKILRGDCESELDKHIALENVKTELGDVLWYVAMLADHLKISLEDVAQFNVKKLQVRFKKGTLKGDGDHR